MLKYIAKRVLIFFPTLIIITVIGFVISINAPGDPVERLMTAAGSGGEVGTQSAGQQEQKRYWKKKLGLDLPIFYFSLSKFSYPDTLYKIYDKNENEALGRLIDEYGNWEQIASYYNKLNNFYSKLLAFKIDTNKLPDWRETPVAENLNVLRYEVLTLKSSWQENIINSKISNLKSMINNSLFISDFR